MYLNLLLSCSIIIYISGYSILLPEKWASKWVLGAQEWAQKGKWKEESLVLIMVDMAIITI